MLRSGVWQFFLILVSFFLVVETSGAAFAHFLDGLKLSSLRPVRRSIVGREIFRALEVKEDC